MRSSKIVFFACGERLKEFVKLSQEQELRFRRSVVHHVNRVLRDAIFPEHRDNFDMVKLVSYASLEDHITDVIYGLLEFVRCWRFSYVAVARIL
jgi:hypothetical protein